MTSFRRELITPGAIADLPEILAFVEAACAESGVRPELCFDLKLAVEEACANVIEHALILCEELPIRPEHLPQRFLTRQTATVPFRHKTGTNLRDLEMRAIQKALDRHQGNRSKAAEELGVSIKTLYNKLNQMAPLNKTA